MGRDKPETGLHGLDYSAVLERAAHQLAALTQAVHDLGRHGPAVMQQGSTILGDCEEQIRQLSSQAYERSGKET
jgi:hypothetical protein